MASARALAMRALVALDRGRTERLRSELDGNGVVVGRDLAFAYELSHGVVRRERLLDFVLGCFAHRGLPKDPQLRVALRLGAYQLLFVPGMPAHAAVHETVAVVRGNKGFANAMLRRVAQAVASRAADPERPTHELALTPTRTLVMPEPLPDDEVARLALVHSLPDWLVARCLEQHGVDGVRAVATAASSTPGIFLRPRAGIEAATLRTDLWALGVETEPCANGRMLRWTGGESPFHTAPFGAGQFVVQDPTAAAAAEALPCGPGDRVIDLCAAPGTKTTYLCERVQPDGRVFAWDPDERRRRRIVENVERLGLGALVEIVTDAASLQPVDHVLVDVPCSNTGVLGRRVEARRRLSPATFAELAKLQRELLGRAIELTRPGGSIVYSTCSIDREENQDLIAAALADQALPRCTLIREHLTLPAAGSHDGGYFAVLRRAPS